LISDVSESVTNYRDYLNDTVKFITDPNVACQEKAIKVLLRYLEGIEETPTDAKSIIKALI
jgi:hypothetical protein